MDFPSLLAVTVTHKGVAVNSILGNTVFRVGFWGGVPVSSAAGSVYICQIKTIEGNPGSPPHPLFGGT